MFQLPPRPFLGPSMVAFPNASDLASTSSCARPSDTAPPVSTVGGCLDVAQDRVGIQGGAERWFNKQVNYQFAIENAPFSSLNDPRFSKAELVYSLPEG